MKAKRLRYGDTIGIVAPASPSTEEKIRSAVLNLTAMGFKVKLGRSACLARGYLAGDDAQRAEDIMEMFADNEVDAVFCLRGGYGSMRILDRLNYKRIRKHPKIFIGYSDITALLNTIYQNTGLITFHGPMAASDLSGDPDDYSLFSMKMLLEDGTKPHVISNPPAIPVMTLREGRAEGRLVGGNLSIITALMGTPYEIETKDRILFMEDIGEEPYRIDRMLTQLRLSGKLRDAAGIVLCGWNNCDAKEPDKSLTLSEVFNDLIPDCGKPVLYGYKIGHCLPKLTIPVGAKVRLDSGRKHIKILEKVVV